VVKFVHKVLVLGFAQTIETFAFSKEWILTLGNSADVTQNPQVGGYVERGDFQKVGKEVIVA